MFCRLSPPFAPAALPPPASPPASPPCASHPCPARRLTLLPMSLWGTCGWMTVPIAALVSFLLLGAWRLCALGWAVLAHRPPSCAAGKQASGKRGANLLSVR